MVALFAGLVKAGLRRIAKGRHPAGLSLVQAALTDALRTHGRLLQNMPPRQARSVSDRLQVTGARTKGVHVQPLQLGPCAARSFRPKTGKMSATRILYFHGGGYVMGSSDSYRAHLSALCLSTTCDVLAPDYRLAPEAPYPAALEDAVACLQAALRVYEGPWVIAGDSSGGALALAAAQRLATERPQGLAGVLLLSPWVDLSAQGGSIEANATSDWADQRYLDNYAAQYLHRTPPTDPGASPLHGSMAGLPPMQVFVGGAELLRDQVRDLATRAREAGVQVTLHEDPGMVHGYWMMGPAFPAEQVHQRAAAWLHQLTASGTAP